MWPVSTAFLTAVTQSHRAVVKVEILDNGQVISDGLTLNVTDGSVTVDANAAVRRMLSITFIDTTGSLVFVDGNGVLAPYGNQIRVSRGIVVNGVPEYVPLITATFDEFRITEDNGAVTIEMHGFDSAQRVVNARYETPFPCAAGTPNPDAIQRIISDRLDSAVQFRFETSTHVTPAMLYGDSAESDPWRDCVQLATDCGMEVFFDPTDVCVLRTIPSPDSSPVGTVTGGNGGNLLKVERSGDTSQTYNVIIASGEGAYAGTGGVPTAVTLPVRASVEDTDPESPTYAGGKFGRHVYRYASNLLTSVPQCADAARGFLKRNIARSEQVSGEMICNPALDAGDVLYVNRPGIGVTAKYVLDSFTVPLRVDQAMTFKCRERQVV